MLKFYSNECISLPLSLSPIVSIMLLEALLNRPLRSIVYFAFIDYMLSASAYIVINIALALSIAL